VSIKIESGYQNRKSLNKFYEVTQGNLNTQAIFCYFCSKRGYEIVLWNDFALHTSSYGFWMSNSLKNSKL